MKTTKPKLNAIKTETKETPMTQPTNETGQISAVNVPLKDDLVFSWLTLDKENYMTTAEVIEMLGTSKPNITQIIDRHGLVVLTLSEYQIKQLKELGVVPLKTTVANLLPRPTIDKLVKIVNTPEAFEIWEQLLKKIRNEEVTGDMSKVFTKMSEVEGTIPISIDQAQMIYKAIYKKYDELGWYCKGRLEETTVVIQTALKDWLDPNAPRYQFTWKQMPRSKFQAALDFINNWVPSAGQTQWYLRKYKNLAKGGGKYLVYQKPYQGH